MLKREFSISNKSLVMIKASLLAAVLIGLVVFFVNVVTVFAGTHTSIVDVTPHIVPNVSSVTFIAHVQWTSGPDPIHEFRVYQPLEFSGLSCDSVTGWYNPTYGYTTIHGTEYYYCHWSAKTGNVLNATNPQQNFTFYLNTAKTECCRDLFVETRDDHGYYAFHNPQVCVDTSAPITTKSFIGPYKIDGDVEWIDGVTLVNLSAVDPQPHPSGVAETWYVNIWAEEFLGMLQIGEHQIECGDPELPCWDWNFCQSLLDYADDIPGGWWNPYIDPFPKPEESCHVLFYYSVDNVGNVEDIKVNCFFVDTTAPTPEKIIGDPNVPCRDGECLEFNYWVMDHVTPITLNCTDEGPHPSGDEEVCYNVSLDSSDVTDKYCDPEDLEVITQPGHEGTWCCVDAPETIIFTEDSLHDLGFFCRDAVDKKSDIDLEWFRVDSQPPIIEKTMIGDDHLGQCPPVDIIDESHKYVEDCYVKDDGLNGVNITVRDNETYGCAVDDVLCQKFVIWLAPSEDDCIGAGGTPMVTGQEVTETVETLMTNNLEQSIGVPCLLNPPDDYFFDYQEVIFTQDSEHWLIVICNDSLGNEEVDWEIFYVDSTPPETNKTFGEPFLEDWFPKGCIPDGPCDGPCPEFAIPDGCEWAEWINSSTPITLTAEDEKVGVDKIWYMDVIDLTGESCGNPSLNCNPIETLYNVSGAPFPASPYEHQIEPECIDECQDCCEEWESMMYNSWEECVEDCAHNQCEVDPLWKLYDGTPIQKPEESCHILQYFSVDHLGNIEDMNVNCFFVDNTEPDVCKDIGEPKEPSQQEGVYYISGQTPIDLYCADMDPHPVDHVSLWYRYRISEDCEDWGEWTDWKDPQLVINGNGGPCDYMLENPYTIKKTIYFPEDSCHELEYYCIDGLGNKGPVHSEIDIVDNQPPEIHKDVSDPKVDCPDREFSVEKCEGAGPEYACWKTGGEWDHKDFTTTGRHDPTNWELAIKVPDLQGDNPVAQLDDDTIWVNDGEPIPFSLTYDPDTGLVKYTVDGREITWTYDSGRAFEYILLVAKGKHKSEDECDMGLFDVEVNGHYIGDIVSDGNYEGRKVYLPDAEQTNGFTVTGYAAMIWEAGCKQQEIPAFHVDAMNTHPLDCNMIDTETEITVDACDPTPHPVKGIWCEWGYWWEGCYYGSYYEDEFPFKIILGESEHEESEHELHIYCEDALGNAVEDVEIFIVDKTPPETWKWYEGPQFAEDMNCEIIIHETPYPHWITSDTEIWLNATDDLGPHVSGVAKTWYRDVYLENEDDWHYCYDNCSNWVEDGRATVWGLPTAPEPYNPISHGFVEWTGEPFKKPEEEESCHIIEYYSYDNVGKVEDVKWQCVFVDNTEPYPNKTVGEPKSKWDGKDSIFYKEETEHCWDGTEDEIECWDVTMQTPISLECIDPEPHPVDHEIVCFKIEVDGKDETERYCSFIGEYNETGDGYCCLESEIEDFLFWEETEHNLKYYCIDALGNSNKGDVDEEKFKVHRATFKIPLYKKWNLISVPFMLLNDTPEEVFKNTEGVESVWALDGNEWLVWTPGPAPDTLEFIEPGWGYWVLENKDEPDDNNCDIERVGCEPAEWLIIGGELFEEGPVLPPGRDLVKGCNLIGYYGTSWELYPLGDANFMCGDAFECFDRFVYGDKAYCALNSLINTNSGYPKWSSLWSYLNCGCYNTYWLGLNACADKSLQQLIDRMYAGRGYWLELDEEDFYSPATVCIWNSNFECVWTGGGYIP